MTDIVEHKKKIDFAIDGDDSTIDIKEGLIYGVVTTIGNADKVNDVLLPGSMDRFIEDYDADDPKKTVPILFNHDKAVYSWAGRFEKFELINGKVYGTARLAMDSPGGSQAVAMLKMSQITGFSIGFAGMGKLNDQGGIDFSEVKVYETSLVFIHSPMNEEAQIISVKADIKDEEKIEEKTDDVVEDIKEDLNLTRAQVKKLRQINKDLDLRNFSARLKSLNERFKTKE